MVFLDTCVWIELCGVKSPVTPNEIRQANLASSLLQDLLNNNEIIVTCNEQLLEIISAVEKIKLKEYNRNAKNNGISGCGNIKEFRARISDFQSTKLLCQTVIEDVKHFSEIHNFTYSIESVLNKIDLADINDCIYYDYCIQENIDFYTFDGDIINLGVVGNIQVLV